MNVEPGSEAPRDVASAAAHPFTVRVTVPLVGSMYKRLGRRFRYSLVPGGGDMATQVDTWQELWSLVPAAAGHLSGWLEGLELVLPRDALRAVPGSDGGGDRGLVMTATPQMAPPDWPTRMNKAVVVAGDEDGSGRPEATTGYVAYVIKARHVTELWDAAPHAEWRWPDPPVRPEKAPA